MPAGEPARNRGASASRDNVALPDLYAPHTVAPTERSQFVLLDGLRGIAAISVAALHMPEMFGGLRTPNGHLAVDFFLQLSGFIVAYAYATRIQAGMSFGEFARRRVGRLYPAYVLGFVLGIAAALTALSRGGILTAVLWSPERLTCGILPQAFMLPQLGCGWGHMFPINLPMWSILYELLFSFLFFFFAAYLVVWQRAIVGALLMLAALLLFSPGVVDVGPKVGEFAGGFGRLGFSFLVGVAIYGVGVRARRTSNWIAALLPLLLFALLAFPVRTYEYELAMIVLVFPAIILLGMIYRPAVRGLMTVLAQLGALSYMLYVIHVPVYQLILAGMRQIDPGFVQDAGPWLGVGVVTSIVLLSSVLARTYEPRARALFERASRRRRAPLPPGAVSVEAGPEGVVTDASRYSSVTARVSTMSARFPDPTTPWKEPAADV